MKQNHSEVQTTSERILTLLCLAAAASAYYGWRVWLLCAAAVSVSMSTELICLYLRKIPFASRHMEAAGVGLAICLMFPPTVSYSVLIISCIFAIIIGRQIFGGSENYLFPAASVGYIFALLSWKDTITLYPRKFAVLPLFSCANVSVAQSTGYHWNYSGALVGSRIDWLTMTKSMPMGSGSILLLGTIAFFLCLRRSTSLFTLLGFLSPIIALNLLGAPNKMMEGAAVFGCLSNLTLFSGIYLISDPRIAPKGLLGFAYGLLVGVFSFFLTQIMHIENAPVFLSVLMQPLACYLNELREKTLKLMEAEGGL